MTRSQLAIKILSKLGAYDQGTAPSAEDQQNALDAYDSVYAELKDDGLVTWAQDGENEDIPQRLALHVATYTASTLISDYRVDQQAAQLLMLQGPMAYKAIRRQLASGQPADIVTAEYF